MASTGEAPCGPESLIGVQQQDAVLRHDPDDHDQAHEGRDVERGAGDQQRQEHARGRKQRRDRIASGAAKLAEFEQQNDEHQHDGEHQHDDQIAERALLLLVGAAVFDANGRGRFSSATAFCTAAMPPPRFRPSSRAVTATSRCRFSRRISVCPGSLDDVGQRAERGCLAGGADQQRVPDRVDGARVCSGIADANGVGTVVHDDRRGRRFALHDGAGVQLDLFRREAGPRGDAPDPPGTVRAGPLMVLSIPFRTSTTPVDLLDASATFGAHSRSRAGSWENSLISTGSGALVRSPIMSCSN